MRTIMAFGFAALLSLLAIGAWSRRDDQLRQSRRGFRRIELADQPARVDEELEDLVHQQYDAH